MREGSCSVTCFCTVRVVASRGTRHSTGRSSRADRPRARRLSLIEEPAPFGDRRPDYADAFAIDGREADGRTPEQFARSALDRAPAPVRWTVRHAQRHLLGLRLGPARSPQHIGGFRVVTSRSDLVCLEAWSPLVGRAVIVGRRVGATSARVTTFLAYERPAAARVAWAVVGPLHRRVTPYLLERAARR